MDVKFHFHHKMMELYILKCLGIVKSQGNYILMLQLHHPAYCDLSSARRSPITLYLSFPKDDESQPCKVGSGENLPLPFCASTIFNTHLTHSAEKFLLVFYDFLKTRLENLELLGDFRL